MATEFNIKRVTNLPSEGKNGDIYLLKKSNGRFSMHSVAPDGTLLPVQGLTDDELEKLNEGYTNSQIDEKLGLASGSVIPVTGTVLPQGASIPSYITNTGKAELQGGSAGKTYTQSGGSPITVGANNGRYAYYNKATDLWTAGEEYALPQATPDGEVVEGDSRAVSGDTTFREFYGSEAIIEETNYPKDLSTYTTLVTNTLRYVNNVKTLKDKERLKSVSVKTPIGSVINVYAYKVTGANGSLVFEQLHHFGSYTTTSETTTINFTDTYEMPLGTVIAISSSLGIYYKTIGGQLLGTSVAQNLWTGTELAHSFVTTRIVSPDKEGVYPMIENVSGRVADLEENGAPANGKIEENDIKAISGDTAFRQFYGTEEISEPHNYTKDLSLYTTLDATKNRIYINNVKTLNADEQLVNFGIKTPIGGIVTVYAYKVTGANGSLVFEQIHDFGSFTATSLEYVHTFNDSFKMPLGTYIGAKSSEGVYYRGAGGQAGTHSANTIWTGTELAHSFTTKVVTTPEIVGVHQKIENLDSRVEILENNTEPITQEHKFKGKIIVFEGDSLMEQNQVTSKVGTIIGCTILNRAKSGSGYVLVRNGTIRSRAEEIAALTKDCIVIGSGGTNDWRNNVPIGSPSVIDNDSQFYSAVYNTFRVLREQNPTTPILVCTPTQGFYNPSSENRATTYSGKYFHEFVQIIRDVARIFSIQVCDLYDISGITYENRANYTTDGLHVNSAGGKLMAEKIVQALDTLVV